MPLEQLCYDITIFASFYPFRNQDIEAEEAEGDSSEVEVEVNEGDVEEDVDADELEGSVIDVSDSEGSLVDFIVSDNEDEAVVESSSGEDLEALAPGDR